MQTIDRPEMAHVGGFQALHDEHDYVISHHDVQGEIPDSMRGTFYRIGPGRNEIGGEKFGHWFDGDGMLHSVTFFDDAVRYRNRYVRTSKFRDETKAQRIVKRSFGHNAPGGWRKNVGRIPANCANTSLVYHGDRLLALWEGGHPYQVDPSTLDTVGRFDFDGRLNRVQSFSAHGKLHPSGSYYNFGLRPSLRGKGHIDLYKISPSGYLVERGGIDVDFLGFFHDFALTENYALFFLSPMAIRNPFPPLLGLQTVDEAMRWQPELGMKIYVVRLHDFGVQQILQVPPFVAIHFGNAWEEDGKILVNVTSFDDFRVGEVLRNIFTLPANVGGELVRFEIDPVRGGLAARKHEKVLPCEFPQWDGRRSCRPTRYVYLDAIVPNGTSGFFNAVQRLDAETGEVVVHAFEPGRFPSEALFVPEGQKGREEDGHVVCIVYDAAKHRSDVVILSSDLQAERAIIPLRNHVPHGFHCGYVDRRFP
jgi:all-trans-8'-apo-beta-carotenal 15,15'-oxygenase